MAYIFPTIHHLRSPPHAAYKYPPGVCLGYDPLPTPDIPIPRHSCLLPAFPAIPLTLSAPVVLICLRLSAFSLSPSHPLRPPSASSPFPLIARPVPVLVPFSSPPTTYASSTTTSTPPPFRLSATQLAAYPRPPTPSDYPAHSSSISSSNTQTNPLVIIVSGFSSRPTRTRRTPPSRRSPPRARRSSGDSPMKAQRRRLV
ncbi:hypothetical protein R3P38DRAFT_3202114 [Favolaschia claudopus]|uniref:Uncharacterized protein n=1 Tax=Favolaschia claudopus TaxID=2862362 RepID=A0AAW0AV17_9AGAR